MKNLSEKQAPSFFEILSANARNWPEAIYAYSIDQQKSVNYRELYCVSNQIAGFLKNYGVGRNQRVLLLSENSIENFLIFVSTLRYGATLATVHVEMNKTHLAEIIESINPVLVIYQPGLDLEFFKSSIFKILLTNLKLCKLLFFLIIPPILKIFFFKKNSNSLGST